MSAQEQVMRYVATKTMRQFHSSNAFVRALMGPIGSGKSVACCNELMRRAVEQEPNFMGVRKTRMCVVRNTYRELSDSTVRTWLDWFPTDVFGRFVRNEATHELRFGLPDGTSVECDVLFRALDGPDDQPKLRSVEYTMGWLNEAKEIDFSIFTTLKERIGRYPAEKDGVNITYAGIIMDTNPPDTDSWFYRQFEEVVEPTWEIYKQPPALLRFENKDGTFRYLPNPDAENVDHQQLRYQYWLNQISGNTVEWINVYVMGEYGTSLDGKPVYPAYVDGKHCVSAAKIPIFSSLPLRLGWDFGRTPACIVSQISPRGGLNVLKEFTSENTDIRSFVREVVRPELLNLYHGAKFYSWADPAGMSGQQGTSDNLFDILKQEGYATEPGGPKGNRIEPRLDSVNRYLLMMIDGEPGFQLSDECRVLRRGFLGGYRYKRIQSGGGGRYKDEPEKNQYSHPHDALQYSCIGGQGEILTGAKAQRREIKVRRWAA